jgi:cytidylate kinase
VPRLIVINGPPGCGKSTLAQMYADEHSLTLMLADRPAAQLDRQVARGLALRRAARPRDSRSLTVNTAALQVNGPR